MINFLGGQQYIFYLNNLKKKDYSIEVKILEKILSLPHSDIFNEVVF